MSFAVDANVLLYASDRDSPLHVRGVELLDEIAMGPELVYLFWPVVMAYMRVATHPAVFSRPLSHADARQRRVAPLAPACAGGGRGRGLLASVHRGGR